MNVVPNDLLLGLANQAQTAESQSAPSQDSDTQRNGHAWIDNWITTHRLDVRGPEPWQGGRRWVLETCPWNPNHTNRSAFIVERADGKFGAGCRHNGCKGKGWHELRDVVEPGWRERPSHKSPAKNQIELVAPANGAAIARYTKFPVDTLPDPIGGFVAAGAKAIGCDACYIALPLLTALATAIGNTRRIQLKRSWLAPPILWTAIVGESGTSKTPAFGLAMRPLKERQFRAMEAYHEAVRSYASDKAYFERAYSQWKRSKSDEEPPEEPPEPRPERYVVSDITVEALAPLLLANPRGVLMSRDELAGWLGSFDRYAGGNSRIGADASHWLSMFNAEGIVVDRKTAKPPTIFVPQAAVCVTGGIQPAILHKALGSVHRESGLAARLLLACPPRRPKRWTETDIAPSAMKAVSRIFDRLYALEWSVDDEGRQQSVALSLTPEAREEWVAYYSAHNLEQVELTGEMSAAWSKLEEYAARLALVIHCLRWAAGEAPPDAYAVEAETMVAAVRLTEWFKLETRRVYALLGESPEEADRRRLVEWLERRGGGTTARDVQQGCRWLATAREAEAALEDLVEAGYGHWENVETTVHGGRPTRVFHLHRASTVYETLEISGENEGCVDVDVEVDGETPTDWGEV